MDSTFLIKIFFIFIIKYNIISLVEANEDFEEISRKDSTDCANSVPSDRNNLPKTVQPQTPIYKSSIQKKSSASTISPHLRDYDIPKESQPYFTQSRLLSKDKTPMSNLKVDDLTNVPKSKHEEASICLPRSKIVKLSDERYLFNGPLVNLHSDHSNGLEDSRRKMDPLTQQLMDSDNNVPTESIVVGSNDLFEEEDPSIDPEPRNAYTYGGITHMCYACSNVSNPHCNEPSPLTTIKHCYAEKCLKKVIWVEGKAILIRTCGDNCEDKYPGRKQECAVCHSELCNGAFSFNNKYIIFNILSSTAILLSIKYL